MATTTRKLNLTPRQTDLMALEIAERVVGEYHFTVPELDEESQRKLWEAKERVVETLRERLKEARRKLG